MKALTVRQPHADRIRRGVKTLEIRSWITHYRGPLLICAGARADDAEGRKLPLGVTLCQVDLVDVRPWRRQDAREACARWQKGLYAWVLARPRAVPMRPLKGRLGLFEAPVDNEN